MADKDPVIIDLNKYFKTITGFLSLCKNINYETSGLSKEAFRTIGQLNGFSAMLMESSINLIQAGCVWENEIILRSILEATIRLIYICIDKNEIEDKVYEFNHILSNVFQTKREKRIENFLVTIDVDDEVLKKSFERVLENHDGENNGRMNRKTRLEVERRWAFNVLTAKIDSYHLNYMNKLSAFAYSYGMASHIAHVDADGIGMIWERDERSEEEKYAITCGHIARQLSDIFWLSVARTFILFKLYKIEENILKDYISSSGNMLQGIESLKKIWNEYYIKHYGMDEKSDMEL
ncbi:MAG: hypothetical protein VR68_02340 [Peptococcaceae bacterium BRH_c4a]|nr:MAG: hypothetical protein VR68_02340 [Peptococcaceae bacterium BRH_c4a]